MSDNVEIVRRALEAFLTGDTEAPLALMDPEVELVEWPEAPDARTFRGHAGALEAQRSWAEAWAFLDNVVEEVIEAGDHVVACSRAHAKGTGSAVEVEIPMFNVFTVRDGKIVRIQFFIAKEPALRAAGISDPGANA
jgi:ketosteroid isomerase-like protein